MNNNIKEILDGLNVVIKQEGSLELDFKECKKILDYITNLQQRNIELMVERDRARGENKVLQDKIDKAIEYIKTFDNIKAYFSYVECGYDEYNSDDDFKSEMLNILEGDNK